MVTRCNFPTARGWNCGRCEAKSPFIFVLEKGRAFHLHRALAGRSNPVGCWHFAVALTHALQKRPSPMLDRPGVVARKKLGRKDILGRVPEVDLSQRVQTYLFDRNALIRGRW